MKPLVRIATTNNKDNPTPSQININPHTKVLFTSVPIGRCNVSSFQKEQHNSMKNSKKKQTRETKQSLEDSDMTLMLGLSEREYKVICYRMNEEN